MKVTIEDNSMQEIEVGATALQNTDITKSFDTQVSGVYIVAAQRGFVWVGKVERSGDCLLIHDARNIRRWGTTRGIGELVNGPTKNTVTDMQGEIVVPWHAIIHLTKCAQQSW